MRMMRVPECLQALDGKISSGQLYYLKKLSNATVMTIKVSICLSMCINLLAVTLSVLGVLNPTTGALVHNAGSCFVVLIAALLYDRKFEGGYHTKTAGEKPCRFYQAIFKVG